MTNVGFGTLSVIPSFDGFQSKLERGVTPGLTTVGRTGGARFGDVAGRSAGARFGSVFKTAAKATLIGVAGAGALAVKFGSDAIGSASELNESLNAVNITYGKNSKAVKRLGRDSAKSLGLSNSEFNSLSVRFSAFTKTIAGGDGKKVVRTLDDLTKRSSDFASVMNLEVGEAAQLFQSGLAGESEPLRKFGIDLSAASVEAFAYANGIAESGAKLTEAEKVQARYGSIMEQTQKTQGDFKNTSDELANQQRILSARFEDAKAKLGKGLLPIMSSAADFLIDKGIPAFEDFSDWFNKDGIPALKKVAGFAKDAGKKIKGLVDGFRDMPGWVQKILATGVIGGTVAVKLGMGDLFKRGSSPVNPLYVLDVSGGGPTKPGKVPGGLGKLGLFGAILAPAAVGLEELHNFHRGDDKNGLASLGRGGINDWFDEKVLGKNTKQVQTLQLEWDEARNRASDYFQLLYRNKNVQLRFTVNGIDLATQKARDYYATLLDIRALRLDFDTPTPGQPPNRSPGDGGGNGGDGDDGKGGGPAKRGVNVNIYGDVRPNDSKEFFGDLQRRSISGAGNGWG